MNASHPTENKFLLLFYPLVILSVQLFLLELLEEETAQRTGLSLLQRPQKSFDAQVGGLKSLTGCHPGSWLLVAHLGPELQTLQEKRGKRKRQNIKEEIVRKLLGCYSLIRSPFLWWSHLLREGENEVQCKHYSLIHSGSIITIESLDFTACG